MSSLIARTPSKSGNVGGKALCFLCQRSIQNKLYVQEIPGVEVVKNKFVCSVHLDLCTACWGPHQSVFGASTGRSASDKKEKDHYWAAKAFKRGVPNAAPYFYFESDSDPKLANDPKLKQQVRKDERPYFECCHPQCFCMKCDKPKIVCRFIDQKLLGLYCTCQGQTLPSTGENLPNWETYGSLGSATHEEGPFALPYIFFQFMYVSLSDLSKKRTHGMKLSPSDYFIDDTWERFVLMPRLKAEKSAATQSNIGFAVQDCKFFLGLEPSSDTDDKLHMLLHYIHMLFRTARHSWPEILEAVDALPEDKRTGKDLFDIIKEKRFRIPLMSVIIWHLCRNTPWGEDHMTGERFGELANEMFYAYKDTVQGEAESYKYGVKELSYLYRASPQIILQNDLGLNIFGRGVLFYPDQKQREKIEALMTSDSPVVEYAKSVCEDLMKEESENETSAEVKLFSKSNRILAVEDETSPAHYKNSFGFVRSFERTLIAEADKDALTEENDLGNLTVASCQTVLASEPPKKAVLVSNDLLRASFGLDSEPEIFQQTFAVKIANAAALKNASDLYPNLNEDDLSNLRRGVFAKGATNSLANLSSPLFKNKFQAYINALKDSKKQNGSPASLAHLDKTINDLIQQVASDAGKLFVSKEAKVGMLLLTGKAMRKKKEAEHVPENVEDWISESVKGFNPEDIDGKTYDAIIAVLENDKSTPWMIATPTFESYLEYILENPTFTNPGEEIGDVDELLTQSNAIFDEAMKPDAGQGDAAYASKFEDKIKKRNEAAMQITPPLKTTMPVVEDLCERLIDDALHSQIPSTDLLNAFTGIDPESVYNNPGLLKIIAESEMGVKSEESNISQIEKMKKQLAGGAETTAKPTKRCKDIIADVCNGSPDLSDVLEYVNEDLITEGKNAPNMQHFMDSHKDEIEKLNPLEKAVFCNEDIVKSKSVDPIRKEAMCKEVLDTLSDEEKAILEANSKSKFPELFPRTDDESKHSVSDDNVALSERAHMSIQQCLEANPDENAFHLAQTLPALIAKRFEELRQFCKENGVENYDEVGLSQAHEIAAVRRAFEALYDRAAAERGYDDLEVNAIGCLLEKTKKKELKNPVKHKECARCGSKLTSKKCTVSIGNVNFKRCVIDAVACSVCEYSSVNGLCVSQYLDENPFCPPLHVDTYYQGLVEEITGMLLGDEKVENKSVTFSCPGAPDLEFWRKVQIMLDQDENNGIIRKGSSGQQAVKLMWENREDASGIYEELLPMTSLNECVEKSSVDVSMGVALKILKRSRAREVLELAIVGLMTVAELASAEDDFSYLAHSFNNVIF